MAKATRKRIKVDNRKLQEIIGRALTDKRFLDGIVKNPGRALASYELDRDTLSLVERGVKLRGQLEGVAEMLHGEYGIEVQSV